MPSPLAILLVDPRARLPFRLLALGAFAIALFVAWQMYQRSAQDLLWGVRPLVLLVASWLGVALLRQVPDRARLLVWSSAAGLLLGINQAPYGAIWAPVLGFSMLLVLVRELVAIGATKKQVLWYAYHAMVLFNVVATWWVANTALAAGIVANFLNALFQALVVLAIFGMAKYQPKVWLVGAIAVWIGFEYLHFNWQIAWPWLCLGHTFAPAPLLAQWFSVTGVFGGSLYVTLTAVCLYRVYSAYGLRTRPGVVTAGQPLAHSVILATATSLLPLLASLLLYHMDQDQYVPDARVQVAAVQPNYEPHYAKFEVSPSSQLARFDSLTRAAIGTGADVVVYPETSFGGIDEARLEGASFVGMWDASAARALLKPSLITGVSSYRRLPGPTADPALRSQVRPDGTTAYYIAHNAAVALPAEDDSLQIYYKSRLVPGVEFLPYRRFLFFFEPLVKRLGGTTAGLGRAPFPKVFSLASGVRAAPLICYESIYGDYVREFVRAGANLLVVPTNDGWWDDSPGHRQHFNLARLRAIETRRWVVQAANSGTSGFVDPFGRAYAKTEYDAATVASHRVGLITGTTLYVRWGDVIGRVMAGGACLLLLSLIGKAALRR